MISLGLEVKKSHNSKISIRGIINNENLKENVMRIN